MALDVTDPASVKGAFAAAEQALGPISIVVNNAGIATPSYFLKMTEEEWRGVLSVNLDGVFRVAQEGARRMKANGTGGSIINIASVLGLGVIKTLAHYSASKAGVIHMTKAVAYELARDKIRVNAIAPGYCETEMNSEFFTARLAAADRARAAGAAGTCWKSWTARCCCWRPMPAPS